MKAFWEHLSTALVYQRESKVAIRPDRNFIIRGHTISFPRGGSPSNFRSSVNANYCMLWASEVTEQPQQMSRHEQVGKLIMENIYFQLHFTPRQRVSVYSATPPQRPLSLLYEVWTCLQLKLSIKTSQLSIQRQRVCRNVSALGAKSFCVCLCGSRVEQRAYLQPTRLKFNL